MKSYEVHPEFTPKFKIGEKVWCINVGRRVESTEVLSIRFELFNEQGKELLVCRGYNLRMLNLNTEDEHRNLDCWPAKEVYATEHEAKVLAKLHAVEDVSEEDWTKAIGNPDDEESFEKSELTPCCAEISNLRDLLMKCRKNKGLIERDMITLRRFCLKGSHMPTNPIPTLKKILEKLDIKF